MSPGIQNQKFKSYQEAWHLLYEGVSKKDASAAPPAEPPASLEYQASAPPPVVGPDAEPVEVPLLRGAVEPSAPAGFDPDLR